LISSRVEQLERLAAPEFNSSVVQQLIGSTASSASSPTLQELNSLAAHWLSRSSAQPNSSTSQHVSSQQVNCLTAQQVSKQIMQGRKLNSSIAQHGKNFIFEDRHSSARNMATSQQLNTPTAPFSSSSAVQQLNSSSLTGQQQLSPSIA
jgi:hypothetical protein